MKLKNILSGSGLVIMIAIFSLGFWGGGSKDKAKPKKAKTSSAQSTASGTGTTATPGLPDLTGVSTSLPQVPKIPEIPKIPQIPKANANVNIPNVKSTLPPTPPPILDPSVMQLQKQIQEIIRTNEVLKHQHQTRATEIQKINEQAKIHQQILDGLQANPERPSKTKIEPTDAKELLRQEKIRLIKEETQKNAQFLDSLDENQPAGASTQNKAH